MKFKDKLKEITRKKNSLLCIGLDSSVDRIPEFLKKKNDPVFEFNKRIIDATSDLVCAYKPNMAFYEADGIRGLQSLRKTIDYLKKSHPEILTICDGKRGDIGNTAQMYAKAAFDYFGFNALTVNPYLGTDAVEPFLDYKDKGIIVLCRTSNKGAIDFQNLKIGNEELYLKVAKKIIKWNKKYHNCAMVIGSTWPEEIKKIRELSDDIPLLVPGIGTQGGDIEKTVKYGVNSKGSGLIINVSRAIIYAGNNKDFAQKAREKTQEFRELINKYR